MAHPYARLFILHQHEEGLVSVENAPAGVVLGIGAGIRHRAGGGLSLGTDIPFRRDSNGKLTWVVIANASGADTIDKHPCPPSGTTLTYDNFGKQFIDDYCVSCHGGPNGYSSRAFTTVESIRASRDRIFANAAADNTFMPPGPDDPPRAERDKLAEWLACGAP